MSISSEHINVRLDFMKDGEFLDLLSESKE
jgi:hypothetical protein